MRLEAGESVKRVDALIGITALLPGADWIGEGPLEPHQAGPINSQGTDYAAPDHACSRVDRRSEEHTSELQSLMRISYAVFCLKKKKKNTSHKTQHLTNTKHTNHTC